MGRYYSGDIEGKFWFGVQSSDDADFFGVTGVEPAYLEYYFEEKDLDKIEAGIAECKVVLGKNKKKFDKFFKDNIGYNNQTMKEAGLNVNLLKWYVRLELGEKIHACVKKNGQCEFEAEL